MGEIDKRIGSWIDIPRIPTSYYAFSLHVNPAVTNAPIYHNLPFAVTSIAGNRTGGTVTLIKFTVPSGWKLRLLCVKSASAFNSETSGIWTNISPFLSYSKADSTPASLTLFKNDIQIASWTLDTYYKFINESINGYYEFVTNDVVEIRQTTPSGYGGYSYFAWQCIPV